MTLSINQIQAPIADELAYFEKYFRSSMQSRVPLLDKVMQYILKRKGKQMRPMIVLLSAQVCGGITAATYRGAALVELLHTATLVHDDVVDDSDERRGFFSINALWKNKIAVLVGDFLLSKGLLMSLEHNDFELLKIVSEAVKLMSEGELLQIEKARKLNIDEAVYFDVIRYKTASLFAACCKCGAASTTENPEIIEKMRLFGEKVGIAFQIQDDLFDYGTNDVGKPLAIDIKERKMTLPLIHVLNKSTWLERRRIINIVRNHNTNPVRVKELIDYVAANNGLEYAKTVMHRYIKEAEELLADLPDSEAKTALIGLIHYAITRAK